MIDPDHELFIAVVEAGSLSAAGRALAISPAMMSKRLTRLEERLGVRLLHRSTRRIALTDQGTRLHADIAPLLSALREAEARVRGEPGIPSGVLRVTAPTSFGRMHLAPHIGRFLDLYPRVALTLDLSDDFTDLMRDPYDIALRIAASIPAGLTAHRLATSERVLCAAPAYLARHGTPATVADLAAHRLLAAVGQLPWRLDGPQGAVTIDGQSHVRTNSSDLVRELTVAGVGIALRSLWDVGDALASGALVRILPDHDGSTDSAIQLVHIPQSTPGPALTALITFLHDLYGPVPPWRR